MKRSIATLFLAVFFVMPAFSQTSISSAGTASTPGYLVVIGRTLDRTKLMAYSAALPPIYAETGGHYIGLGRPGGGVMCVYGLCEGRSVVIARWADAEGIDAFWWGEKYRKAVRLRDNAGGFTVVGLKGISDVAPFEPGALLLATFSGAFASPAVDSWVSAAEKAGAKLLAPIAPNALMPLEGDALYSRIALLSFEAKEKRDAFVAGETNQALIKSGQSLMSMLAIDALLAR